MLTVKCQGDFKIFQFALAIHRQKKRQKETEDSAETFEHYVSNGFGIPLHFAKGSDFCFLTVEIICST